MALKFNNAWRFTPPEAGQFRNKAIPAEAIEEFLGLASKVATQGVRQGALEHFKREFAPAAGFTRARSSNESWAATDLERRATGGPAIRAHRTTRAEAAPEAISTADQTETGRER